MALTTERINELLDDHTATNGSYPTRFAQAIEAEVRAQDEVLIRELVEALGRSPKHDDADYAALRAGRARLKGKT